MVIFFELILKITFYTPAYPETYSETCWFYRTIKSFAQKEKAGVQVIRCHMGNTELSSPQRASLRKVSAPPMLSLTVALHQSRSETSVNISQN